jgi:four helix bundle protein
MKENIVKKKSFEFAIKVVKLYQFLCESKKEFVMSKQILRSGTSVGAMVRESEHAESKPDFIHKLAIAQKELNESMYWLELLKTTKYIDEIEFLSLYKDSEEIMKLITSIIKTSKANLKQLPHINH